MKWFLFVFALMVAGFFGAYWWAGKDEISLTNDERAKAPGEFLELTDGKIHYLVRGPSEGPTVVMVHGFSTPHFIFEQNASSLAANGFRVVQFDHFGRGWSDRPSAKYDQEFYERELLELLDGLEIKEPIGLVGLSMGGIITTDFASRYPSRIDRVLLLVPAGLDIAGSDGRRMQLTKSPVLGDWIWRLWGKQTLLGDPQYSEAEIPEMNRLQGDVTEQMLYKGYFPALLSTMRNLQMSDRDDAFVALSETEKPVLAIFGDEDTTIPISAAEKMREIMPAADVRILSEAGHGLNYKDFEIINPWMVEFFNPMLSNRPTTE